MAAGATIGGFVGKYLGPRPGLLVGVFGGLAAGLGYNVIDARTKSIARGIAIDSSTEPTSQAGFNFDWIIDYFLPSY